MQPITGRQQSSLDFLNGSGTNTPTQPSGDNSNWFTKLLPTLGSVAAPLIGAALAPETGGLSLLASLGLGAAGSAGGKLAENAAEGKDATEGLGSSLLEGAAGSGIGMGVGKVAGGLLGKVGDFAGGKVAQAAEQASTAPYRGLKSPDLVPTLDKMKGYGVDTSDPNNLLQAANAITGENGAINGLVRQHITNAGPVKIDPDMVMSAMQEHLANPQLTGVQASRAQNLVQKMVQGFNPEGSLTGTADPNDVFDAIQQLGKLKAGLNMSGESGQGLGKVYDSARQALQSSLYNNSGADAIAAAYRATPEDIAAITKAAGGNKALADYAINAINDAKSIQELRSAQAPFVQASQLGNKAIEAANSKLPTMSAEQAVGDQMGMSPEGSALALLASHHPIGAMGATMAKTASKLPPELMQNAAGAAQRLAGSKGAQAAALGASQLLTHAPSLGNDNNSAPVMDAAATQGGPTMDQLQTNGTPGGPSLAWAGLFAPSIIPALERAQQAKSAQPMLDSLQQAYGEAGGGQGLGGVLGEISSLIPGTKAHMYNQQKIQAAAAISKATGMPLPSVLAAMPSLMSGGEGAQNEFGALQGGLSTLQSQPSFGGGSVLGVVQ